MVLRVTNGSKRGAEKYIMGSFIICTLQQIIRVTKSRRMKWTGHIARMEENYTENLVRKIWRGA
jgi:antitoxin component of MazEF toxin-antitoxin module